MTSIRSLNRVLLKSDLRDSTTLATTFLIPAVLLIVLVRAFGDAAPDPSMDYVSQIAANVIAFGVAYVGIFAGALHLATWRENGMFQVLKAFPISTGMILTSQAFVGALLMIAQVIVVFLLALTPWVGMNPEALAPVGLVPLFLGYLLFYFVGVLLAIVFPSIAAVSMLSNLIIIPLGFVGGAVMPLEVLPDWVVTLAPYTPIHHLRVALFKPVLDVGTWWDAGLGCLYLVGVTLVFYLITRKTFTWK
ncbi:MULTISPECIES: ABC transporter permease [unclassified Corynebacterium]|uniref:ABC transporter permease n=1 Tax=unclassified Corynebacterium TaxID=2624378 RepID=UPI003525F973